jgi:RNA polymerase sigma-70 factor, ECF subfamily
VSKIRPLPDTERVMDDDDRRFDALWRDHHLTVLAYARRRAPRALADEVLAETFAVAWRRRDELPAQPAAWLIGVARRVLANRRRGERRARALLARLGSERAACAPDPADLVGADHVLRDAFATLGARDRELLALVAWEGMGVAEAAVALDLPAPMVSARLHRARGRLRRALEAAGTPTVAGTGEEAR